MMSIFPVNNLKSISFVRVCKKIQHAFNIAKQFPSVEPDYNNNKLAYQNQLVISLDQKRSLFSNCWIFLQVLCAIICPHCAK